MTQLNYKHNKLVIDAWNLYISFFPVGEWDKNLADAIRSFHEMETTPDRLAVWENLGVTEFDIDIFVDDELEGMAHIISCSKGDEGGNCSWIRTPVTVRQHLGEWLPLD
jgi:hypothetical protein